MLKKAFVLVLCFAVAAVCLTFWLGGDSGGHAQEGPPAAPPQPEVGVVTLASEPVTVSTILPGRVSAYLVAEVRPQVGGILQNRLFVEGADVKAGDVLYQIDPARYQAAYDNAKAALAKAEANAVPVRLKAARTRQLIKEKVISQQDDDDAQAAIRQAEAEIAACKAALETARIDLRYTQVTAPVSGRIGKSNFTPGALVTANQAQPLSTVQSIDPLYVDLTQPSQEVLRLKRDFASGKLKKSAAGKPVVSLMFEDGTPYRHSGELQFSDITVDQSTGVITVRAAFPNPEHELLPGMYVRAVLEEGVRENALLVPQQAVTRDPKGAATALVLGRDDTVEERTLDLGRAVGDKWLVRSGLEAGDRVIVDGLQKVRPGAKAKPVSPERLDQSAGPAKS
ncbi:efflux RND transporter periplasmic adaptor subunit [Fundidesulfovibrio butyratiphilus]